MSRVEQQQEYNIQQFQKMPISVFTKTQIQNPKSGILFSCFFFPAILAPPKKDNPESLETP